MAHQTEIVINGATTEVTEFDHTAQEIDDGIDNLHTLTGGATTKQGALANLGAGVRPNELDNPGLSVNQRGQDSYTGNGGEPVTFDRWQAGLHTTIAENGGNIVVSASGGDGYILQRLENPILGKPIVFSVLTTSGLYECKGVVNSGGTITQATPFGAISVAHGARMYALIRLNDGQSITLPVQDGDVVKLEIGDTQTLAYQDDTGAWQLLPQPESDYATQLAKCQRYLVAMEEQTIVRSAYVSLNFVDFLVPIPVSFRVLPTIQSAEKLVLITYPDQVNVSGVTWSIVTKSSVSVRLRASKPNILSEGTDFSVYTDSGATFFSAEL